MFEQRWPVHLGNEADTIRFGKMLAAELKGGGLVCLFGGLGVGKTTLARAIIHEMQLLNGQHPEEVPSPTYTLVQPYQVGDLAILHYDLYRIEKPEDVYELAWEDALTGGLVLVEWPERLGPLLPEDRLDVHLSLSDEPGREIRLQAHGAWKEAVLHAGA